jgi:hypothetical protein
MSYPQSRVGFQFMPQTFTAAGSCQQIEIKGDQAVGVLSIFIQELNPEIPQTSPLQSNKILSAGLGSRVEDRIPATDIRFH